MATRKRTAFERYVARLMLDPKFRAAYEKERRAMKKRQAAVKAKKGRGR